MSCSFFSTFLAANVVRSKGQLNVFLVAPRSNEPYRHWRHGPATVLTVEEDRAILHGQSGFWLSGIRWMRNIVSSAEVSRIQQFSFIFQVLDRECQNMTNPGCDLLRQIECEAPKAANLVGVVC